MRQRQFVFLGDKSTSKYPACIGGNLESYLGLTAFWSIGEVDEEELFTVRTGKQELFTGLSKVPMLLGLGGEDNLDSHGVSVPPGLERNIGPGYRHVDELKQGSLSPNVESWHWIITKDETAAAGEISGMPHIDERGSIDAGDIFYTINAEREDPLYLEFMRTEVLEGH